MKLASGENGLGDPLFHYRADRFLWSINARLGELIAMVGNRIPASGEDMEAPLEESYIVDLLDIGRLKSQMWQKAKRDAEAEAARRRGR